jgi:hypothetical protein
MKSNTHLARNFVVTAHETLLGEEAECSAERAGIAEVLFAIMLERV